MPFDRITLKNMVFYGSHGVSPAERELGQRFEIDLTLYLDLGSASSHDKLSETVNYGEVYALVEEIATTRIFNLLERLAQVVAEEVSVAFNIEKVDVVVRKPRAPIKGTLDYVEVAISRSKTKIQ